MRGVVVKLDRGFPLVRLENGDEIRCEHAVSLVKNHPNRAVIGDNVEVCIPEGHDKGIIETTLPRTTKFVRKDPTERALAQTLAANFDVVIVAQPLEDIQYRRLERELVLAHETGAEVIVVLTKADLISSQDEIDNIKERIHQFIGNDDVMVVSEKDPSSICALEAYLAKDNKRAVLIGRSGVGKSSLINMMVGRNIQQTTPVRERDGKGRHTTVSREIIALPKGGAIIDMPGVRGLGLWDAQEGIGAAFADVEILAQQCKFRDCSHTAEPGCAVRAAVEQGALSQQRLASYLRLKEENSHILARKEEAQRMRERRGHPRRRG